MVKNARSSRNLRAEAHRFVQPDTLPTAMRSSSGSAPSNTQPTLRLPANVTLEAFGLHPEVARDGRTNSHVFDDALARDSAAAKRSNIETLNAAEADVDEDDGIERPIWTYKCASGAIGAARNPYTDSNAGLLNAADDEDGDEEDLSDTIDYRRASGAIAARELPRPDPPTTLYSGFRSGNVTDAAAVEGSKVPTRNSFERGQTSIQSMEELTANLRSLMNNGDEQMRRILQSMRSGPLSMVRSGAEQLIEKHGLDLKKSEPDQNVLKSPAAYTLPFCDFLTENPTVWHAVQHFEKRLAAAGFRKLSERQTWTDTLEKGGKYYTTRNGSSLIAFTIGSNYKPGNGVAMIAGHVDALTARLKAVSNKKTTAGYVQLGVAPYAGALNSTWWDRDLGIGGRVLVKDGKTGKIETKLVKLGWPIARIPTLAPHFGVGMTGSNNAETEAVPIIGLDNGSCSSDAEFENLTLGGAGSFTATQPPKLVRAIAGELSILDYSSIVNWELELFDTQPAQVGGLDKEFIFAGRIDDKLCSWSAIEALLISAASTEDGESDGVVNLVGVFDDEEIGSLLRQGAKGNFLPITIERIAEAMSPSASANILAQTYANSFLISADVTHAVNPNFLARYLENHSPRLNVGLVVSADSNGHMTTDSVSAALLTRVAEKTGTELQLFAIRNDSRSGGTVGPMLSSAMGVRAIDAGIPQLSMHSIRATTGALDPGLGVKIFAGFFHHFQGVDAEFE